MKNRTTLVNWLQVSAMSLSRIHFYLAGLYFVYVVLSDAWKLITPTVVLQRISVTCAVLIVTTTLWFLAFRAHKSAQYYRTILVGFIALDTAVASLAIYGGRGMASRAVVLYCLPIITSGLLLSRRAIFASTSVAVSLYVFSAVRYFVLHPSEGYRAELYTEVGFYSGILFVVAAITWTLIRQKNDLNR